MSKARVAIETAVSLASLTSWRVGGPAEFLVQPRSIDEVLSAVQWALDKEVAITVLGGGTNVLVSDAGVKGLVVALRRLTGLTTEVRKEAPVKKQQEAGAQLPNLDIKSGNRGVQAPAPGMGTLSIECLAGTSKTDLLKIFLKHKLMPALLVAGLPGDVGGGIAMNAGVSEPIVPREFVEITEWIEVVKWTSGVPQVVRMEASELEWSYRHCKGWEAGIIVRAGLSWPMDENADVLNLVRAANLARAHKQPLDLPSCGSVFINPPGKASGRLIEAAGLKGFKIGGAKVSEKHANFIVNYNQASAGDIHQVIETVRSVVREQTGIHLKTEVVYLGEW